MKLYQRNGLLMQRQHPSGAVLFQYVKAERRGICPTLRNLHGREASCAFP